MSEIDDLFNAVAKNDIGLLESFNRGKLDMMVNVDGYTLLHEAAHYSNEETISFLLEKWTNVNVKDNSGNTPLMEAVNYSNTSAILNLLKNNADVSVRNNDTYTALWFACACNNEVGVDLLLQAKADSNEKYINGQTPIIVAAQFNSSTEIISKLIHYNANVNAEITGGFNALIYSIIQKNVANAGLLIRAGAEKNIVLDDGRDISYFIELIEDVEIKSQLNDIINK